MSRSAQVGSLKETPTSGVLRMITLFSLRGGLGVTLLWGQVTVGLTRRPSCQLPEGTENVNAGVL